MDPQIKIPTENRLFGLKQCLTIPLLFTLASSVSACVGKGMEVRYHPNRFQESKNQTVRPIATLSYQDQKNEQVDYVYLNRRHSYYERSYELAHPLYTSHTETGEGMRADWIMINQNSETGWFSGVRFQWDF